MESSERATDIPQILTIYWAWLILAEVVESVVLHRAGRGDDSPVYVVGAWSLLQAGWLHAARQSTGMPVLFFLAAECSCWGW